MHLKAVIEYDGTAYYGFQIQTDRKTVQGEIQKALKKLFSKKIEIKYTSRTDRGVHAKGQIISFDNPLNISSNKIQKALNSCFHGDIIFREIIKCNPEFNPRYHLESKTYLYRILNHKISDYKLNNFVWHIPEKLNWRNISEGVKSIKGKHDFSFFASNSDKEKNTNIEIHSATFERTDKIYEIGFTAKYFLTYMLRYLIGFLMAIGREKETVEKLKQMLNGKGKICRYCAPAKGLELKKVLF